MGSLIRDREPGNEPVTLAEAREQVSVSADDGFDDQLNAIISRARSSVETFLKMCLMVTPHTYKIDGCFPWEIRLPVGPVFESVASPEYLSIDYVDDAGADQTLATTEYQVSYGMTGVIRPSYGNTWPVTRPIMDAVTVNFHVGWEDRDNIRPAIRQAILMTVGDYFTHRENIVVGTIATELPISARSLLMPFVRHD